MIGILHRDIGLLPQAESDLPEIGQRTAEAGQTPVAAVGQLAGIRCAEVALPWPVGGDADAGLTDVVPASPGKVPDQGGKLFHQFPVAGDLARAGLGADHNPVGVAAAVRLISCGHIVVACHIQRRAGLLQAFADGPVTDDLIHLAVHHAHEVVDVSLDLAALAHLTGEVGLYLGNGVLSATHGIEQPSANVPHAENIAAPEADDLPSAESVAAAALDGAPKVDDIVAPETVSLPSAESLAAAALEGVPTVEDITAPEFDTLPPVEDNSVPELDDITAVPDLSAPAFDSFSKARDEEAAVLDDIYEATLNQPVKAEEEYDYYMSDFNNNGAPNGAEINGAEQKQAQQPQIVKVPQFAGYDANNQPVYKYVQMRLAGYDQNGKPVFVPLNAQQRPAAPAQQTAAQAQRAASAPVQQAQVKSPVPRKPVQTNGAPTANISKIAVNPHAKSTSQAFINAIASSREYADKNLIETQGLQANSPVLTSVEDVLSTMGDDSAKRRQVQQAQQNVPVFDEYKAPVKQGFRGNSTPRAMQPQPMDARYMTKAELKNKKKQDKIDAKFRKEMSKRGF